MQIRFTLMAFSLSLFLLTCAQAPNWAWAHRAGGTDNDYGRALCADNKGYVYVAAASSSPFIAFAGDTLYDPNGTSYTGLLITCKYNTNGNVIWVRAGVALNGLSGQLGNDSLTAIATDGNGNVYITGNFASPKIIFGQDTLTNTIGESSFFLVKYDSSGNVVWANSIGGGNNGGHGVSVDIWGNVYATGKFTNTISFGNTQATCNSPECYFITKYNAEGNAIWTQSANDTVMGNAVCNDLNGNVYVTGSFEGTSVFTSANSFVSTTLVSTPGSQDVFIIKYDTSGHIVWSKKGWGNGNNSGLAISANSSVAVTGFFESDTFGIGTDTLLSVVEGSSIFTTVFDTMGNLIWAKNAGDGGLDKGNSVYNDKSGNTYITGNLDSATITIGDSLINQSQWGNIFMVKYDTAGNILWAKNSDGRGRDCITGDTAGNIYITGSFNDSYFLYGNDTLRNYDLSGGNWWDFFVGKLGENDTVFTGIFNHLNPVNNGISVYPNPSHGKIFIRGLNPADLVEVYDAVGMKVLSNFSVGYQCDLDLGGNARGLYIVRVINHDNSQMQQCKFILQ